MDGIPDKCQVAHTYILVKCRGVWIKYSNNGFTFVGCHISCVSLIPILLIFRLEIFGTVYNCNYHREKSLKYLQYLSERGSFVLVFLSHVPYLTLIFLILGGLIHSMYLVELV